MEYWIHNNIEEDFYLFFKACLYCSRIVLRESSDECSQTDKARQEEHPLFHSDDYDQIFFVGDFIFL